VSSLVNDSVLEMGYRSDGVLDISWGDETASALVFVMDGQWGDESDRESVSLRA